VPSTIQELLHPLPNLAFFLHDPWPAYRWLRDESPVHHQPYGDDGIYLLSRYADVADVSRRPDTFSHTVWERQRPRLVARRAVVARVVRSEVGVSSPANRHPRATCSTSGRGKR
jgi:cytochrome P450